MALDRVIFGSDSRSAKIAVAPSVLERLPEAETIEGLAIAFGY